MNTTSPASGPILHPALGQLVKLAQVSVLDLHIAEIILGNSVFAACITPTRLQALGLLLVMLSRQTVSQADVCLNLDEIGKQLGLGELQHRLTKNAANHAKLLEQLAASHNGQPDSGLPMQQENSLQQQLQSELEQYRELLELCNLLKKPEEILAAAPAELLSRLEDGELPHELPQAVLILQQRRLYFARSYYFESILARQIVSRHHAAAAQQNPQDPAQLEQQITAMVSGFRLEKEQLQAVGMALCSNFSIITGGPGTGKTTIISVIIAMLLQQQPELEIMLCAPTGKAQARMQESIIAELGNLQISPELRAKMSSLQCATIHRLLGVRPNSNSTRYDQNHPLHCDVLIVDEASMIKQELMARLLLACPAHAKLVIIGDRFQLASIEAGCVLADLCRVFADNPQRLCELKVSKRFDPHRGIGRFREILAGAEQAPAASLLAQVQDLNLQDPEKKHFHYFAEDGEPPAAYAAHQLEEQLQLDANGNGWCAAGQQNYRHTPSLPQAWRQFESLRLLAVLNEGPYGVEQLNRLCRGLLDLPAQGLAHGLPLIITANHPASGLFNGDLGLCWYARKTADAGREPCSLQQALQPGQDCELLVYFPRLDKQGNTTWQALRPAQLPEFADAFALTIHKAQGSGYNKVLIWLGYKAHKLLSRELLYTAVTRARQTAFIYASPQSMNSALVNVTKRYSGLGFQASRSCDLANDAGQMQ